MKIIVGLGNIGDKYKNNRHNCGFMVLDEFARQLEKEGTEIKGKEESKFKAIVAKITYKNSQILLVKPTTLMNKSGEAVSKILNFYKELPENLIVIYDDIDLPLGSIRIRDKGSAGTHNGMKSVIALINTEEFTRVRLGIESRGDLSPKQQDISSFVLSDFTAKENPIIKKTIKDAVKELLDIATFS